MQKVIKRLHEVEVGEKIQIFDSDAVFTKELVDEFDRIWLYNAEDDTYKVINSIDSDCLCISLTAIFNK